MPVASAAAARPLLERGRWFAALPPERQQALLAGALLRRCSAGETLFLRGDADDGLYAVLDGAVRIGATDGAGRATTLAVLEAPHWFGEIALFDGGPRTHDAVAHTATTLLRVPRPALVALLEADPLWWRLLGQLLAEKLRALFTGLEDLAALPAPARLARRLLAIAEGHGMLAPGLARRQVAVSQEQLGTMLALSRQTVSEILRDFEARGWVQRRYGGIELLDPQALQAIAPR